VTGVLLSTGLLLFAVAMVIVPPLLAPDRRFAPASQPQRRRAVLESRREELYLALREAELDWRTGKLTEEDHQALRERLVAEAAGALRELDELEKPDGAAPEDGPPPVVPPPSP
jgi:hypothetical protein